MRIIAGRFRGRRLATPPSRAIRPTSDKLRETLFNILAPRVSEARVLDGFAGTGALGLEALSRGARHVTFVDQDAAALGLVRENLRRCGVEKGYAIIRASVSRAATASLPAHGFDLILLDPPYGHTDIDALIQPVAGLLAADGVMVVEHARRVPSPSTAGCLERYRLVVSGDSALSFYRAMPEAPAESQAHEPDGSPA